ncbi:MAG: CHASE3 domain-containing protein, partial [Rhodothermales bacterium]|nr:CHASE3 domain-containing protein [Rhodothermales bacterium]
MTTRRLFIVFGLIVLALLASAAVSWQAASQVIQNEQRVVHTQQIISELRGLNSALVNAEAAKFIYGYTRQAESLTPFYSAKDSLHAHLARIEALTQDNPEQQQRAEFLREAATAKYARLDSVVQLSRLHGLRAAQPYMADRRGQTLLARVRLIVDEMSSAEEAQLVVRSAASQASVNRLMGTIGLTTLMGLVMVGFLYRLVERYLTLQRIEQEGMAASNERLAVAVDERTHELQDANAGLQRLTEELQRSNRELQDFAYVASHDLQEPLRKI